MIPIRHDPVKRGFDILFSAVALVIGAPLFVILALLVKGPAFYRSARLGRGGKIIYCIKFRTMYVDAEKRLKTLLESDSQKRDEWAMYQKLRSDPRITPLGRFLRRTSLDEIPQFWNVIKGDLSIVGPRPLALTGPAEQYLDEIQAICGEDTNTILSVRPGITGIWQVSGRSKIPLYKRLKMETTYIQTRTFFTDLVLIVKTIPAVIFTTGAF
jgi:undecaprenyl-phosphate galactose phosphotransferase